MSRLDDAELVQPASRAALRRWLTKNHSTSPGVWLVSYTKSSGKRQLPYEDVVLELLCFGWVDSQVRTIDEERGAIYIAPRKKGSTWAATNKARVKILISEGLMQPAGQAVIDRAKQDGSWTVLDPVEALEVPDDLAKALRKKPAAKRRYEAMSNSAKKQVLWSVISAKRAETRAARIQRFLDADG
jgi:uncharacterized protein YdeI (YjbR/CyaY-like superfamily)